MTTFSMQFGHRMTNALCGQKWQWVQHGRSGKNEISGRCDDVMIMQQKRLRRTAGVTWELLAHAADSASRANEPNASEEFFPNPIIIY